jgi:hypothetical protein
MDECLLRAICLAKVFECPEASISGSPHFGPSGLPKLRPTVLAILIYIEVAEPIRGVKVVILRDTPLDQRFAILVVLFPSTPQEYSRK